MNDPRLGKLLHNMHITVEQIRNEYKLNPNGPMCEWNKAQGITEEDAVESLTAYNTPLNIALGEMEDEMRKYIIAEARGAGVLDKFGNIIE